ncbi:hypothetical protein P171DRAFT_449530 [Karstenula rhodostoma CBS 690.94]|uniref:Uncharacterized protein n=1 Tax=Karstenula rhodostoma CBS 690.94 TaxID=1392251 RepID=A0A9P4P742_9PLEO|nr:hypothetical protein P171DRAFT_449530 [Karstenula rhodostoma CBS 690.94]
MGLMQCNNPTRLRYTVYVLLSALAVVTFETLPTWLALLLTAAGGALSSYTLPTKRRLPRLYCTLLAPASVAMRGGAYAMQHCVESDGSTPQAYALHFALAFCIISECEYARLYLEFRPLALDAYLPADILYSFIDKDFEESRDALVFWPKWPEQLRLGSPDGILSMDSLRRITVNYLLSLLYFGILSCLSYLVKLFANPDPTGSNFPIMGGTDVLFTPHVFGWHVVQFILNRPIRLLNRMLFCMCAGWLEQLWFMGRTVWARRRSGQEYTVTAEADDTAEGRQPHAGISPPLRTDPPVPGTRSAVVEAQSGQD